MPYSDPLADGPVIQASGLQALQNGMTIATLFDQLKDFRKSIHLPVILMGYLNPILQYGFEAFVQSLPKSVLMDSSSLIFDVRVRVAF
jgi:tryptophan synthase alpha chain